MSSISFPWKSVFLSIFVIFRAGVYICSSKSRDHQITQHHTTPRCTRRHLTWFKVRDALDISWLHSVNSPTKLDQGLSGEIMMLEADVLMRNNQVCQGIYQWILFPLFPLRSFRHLRLCNKKRILNSLNFASDLVIN